MKNILLNLTLMTIALISFQGLSAQSNEKDTIKNEPSVSQQLTKINGNIKSHTKDIDEIRLKVSRAGYLFTEAARLQNQSRAVLFVGSALSGILLVGTGNITAFSVIFGGACLISIIDAIDSSSKLKKAGLMLIEINYN